MPGRLPWWCDDFGSWVFVLACLFLLMALAAAGAETFAAVRAKLKGTGALPDGSGGAESSFDPAALLEAVRQLLETLKGLPAWIAIFLAGLALLWMSAELAPRACRTEGAGAPRPQAETRQPQAAPPQPQPQR